MKSPIKGMKYRPFGEDHMIGAWVACLEYALTNETLRREFKQETGIDIYDVITATGLKKMIDEATGYQKEAITQLADWVTKNLWGIET